MSDIWINRDISAPLKKNNDPIQILRGPRQCGKSSLILYLGGSYQELSLDDPGLRSLAQQGHLFENLVFNEIYKTIINFDLDSTIYHWRTRGGEEVDFLFIEAKVSPRPVTRISESSEVKKIFKSNIPPQILVYQEGERVLDTRVPIRHLRDFLLQTTKSF